VEDSGGSESGSASAHEVLERASELADRGEYGESLALAERAIELDPSDPAAHVAKGWALENLGRRRLTDAGDAYRAALRADERSLWAAAGLATVAERLGDDEEAARLFRRVADTPVASDEGDSDVLEIVGWSRFKAGRFVDSQILFRQALGIDPSLMAVHLDLALALLFSEAGDEALSEYRAALTSSDAAAARAHAAVALDDLVHAVEGDLGDGPPGAMAAADLLRSVSAGGQVL
jgi:tetratricopeptide (TPR) repeat protein